jgi:signal transduction histidine kinase
VAGAGVLLLFLLAGHGARNQLRDERRAGARRTAVADQQTLANLVQDAGDLAARLALLDDDGARRAVELLTADSGVDAAALAEGTASGPVTLSTPLDPGPLLRRRGLLDDRLHALVALAADRPTVVTGPFLEGGRRYVVGAAPRLRHGADTATGGDRRAAVTGYAFVAIRLDPRPPAAAQLVGPEAGRATWPGPGTPGDLFAGTFVVEDRSWAWSVGNPSEPRSVPLGVAGAGLPAALLAAWVTDRTRQRVARANQLAEGRAHQLRLIDRAGSQLQRSLDLGEILPAFAVEVADDFDLAALSVLVSDEGGRQLEVFRLGRDDGAEPVDVGVGLAVGATGELPLRQGWRTVGSLRIRASRSLDEVELNTLHALAELLAIALANAQLFQRERDAASQLRELDALKNAFLGTVSHELRTPTAAITGFADLLDQHWAELTEERRRDLARRIGRNAGSLRHLIDALLDFARLEQERMAINPRDIPFDEVVHQAAEQMQPLLPDHVLDLRRVTGVTAWADPFAVERILANLLSNAGKYAPAGSRVTVEVLPAGDRARLIVSDQGPGIRPADRDRIFTRFWRGSDETTLRTRGAGIGLAILAEVASASDATVLVEDAPGGGARFVVDFPVSAPAPAAGGDR